MAIKATTKRLQIDKANAMMVMVIAVSSLLVTFSLVATRALLTQRSYQSRVIKEKEKARDQLTENIKAAESLQTSYKQFTGAPENVIGGNPQGPGDRDGDNGKIILDALPSKYDFPALATSLEKLFSKGSYKLKGVSGSDDELNQNNKEEANPEPVEIPFGLTVEGSYNSMKDLFSVLERSIRPINVQTITITGNDSQLTVDLTAKTYYQPGKTLKIDTKVVK